MWKTSVHPAFNDLDPLAHINNTRIPVWFELAREQLFAQFAPELDLVRLPLIMARITVDYISQMKFGADIEIHTYVKKIGRTSVTAYQEAYQKGVLGARGDSVLVYFDYTEQKPKIITEDIIKRLNKHLLEPDHPGLKTRSGRFPALGR